MCDSDDGMESIGFVVLSLFFEDVFVYVKEILVVFYIWNG